MSLTPDGLPLIPGPSATATPARISVRACRSVRRKRRPDHFGIRSRQPPHDSSGQASADHADDSVAVVIGANPEDHGLSPELLAQGAQQLASSGPLATDSRDRHGSIMASDTIPLASEPDPLLAAPLMQDSPEPPAPTLEPEPVQTQDHLSSL